MSKLLSEFVSTWVMALCNYLIMYKPVGCKDCKSIHELADAIRLDRQLTACYKCMAAGGGDDKQGIEVGRILKFGD